MLPFWSRYYQIISQDSFWGYYVPVHIYSSTCSLNEIEHVPVIMGEISFPSCPRRLRMHTPGVPRVSSRPSAYTWENVKLVVMIETTQIPKCFNIAFAIPDRQYIVLAEPIKVTHSNQLTKKTYLQCNEKFNLSELFFCWGKNNKAHIRPWCGLVQLKFATWIFCIHFLKCFLNLLKVLNLSLKSFTALAVTLFRIQALWAGWQTFLHSTCKKTW